jgi:hypothetical protein
MRNPELSRSTQIIISAIFSALVTIVLVLGTAVYQSITGAWTISNASLATFALVVSLAVLLKEIVQMLMASDAQQKQAQTQERTEPQWTSIAHTDTMPQPVVSMQQPVVMQARKLRDYVAQ